MSAKQKRPNLHQQLDADANSNRTPSSGDATAKSSNDSAKTHQAQNRSAA
jgi:hypothetical protein